MARFRAEALERMPGRTWGGKLVARAYGPTADDARAAAEDKVEDADFEQRLPRHKRRFDPRYIVIEVAEMKADLLYPDHADVLAEVWRTAETPPDRPPIKGGYLNLGPRWSRIPWRIEYGEIDLWVVQRATVCRACGGTLRKGGQVLRFPWDFHGSGSRTITTCSIHRQPCVEVAP